MSKFHITDIISDEDVLASRKKVRLGTSGEISFETPMRVGQDQVKNGVPLYEAYKTVKLDTLNKCLGDSSYDTNYSRKLKNLRNDGFTILTLGYGSTIDPTPKQIALMADLQYMNTDVVVIPSWYDLILKEDAKLKKYIELSEQFKSVVETLNNKPVIAAIPQCIPPGDLEELMNYWMNKDVVSFIVDSSTRSPLNGTWLRNLKREIDRYDTEKESLLYSINAYQCHVQKNTKITEARDFLGFNTAFDIIGGKHVVKGSSDFYEKTKTGTKGKLFDPSRYCYINIECTPAQASEYKQESISRQIDEMTNIRNNIAEGVKMIDLLESKSINKKTIDKMVGFKKDVSNKGHNSKLSDYI